MQESNLTSLDTILSICYDQAKIGAVFYDLSSKTINFISDLVEETDHFNLIQILQQIAPSQLILSSRINERTREEIIKSLNYFSDSATNSSECMCSVIQVSPHEYDYKTAFSRLCNIKFEKMSDNLSETDRKLYISSMINTESVNMIRAAGALLGFLQTNLRISLDGMSGRPPVYKLKMFPLVNCTFIDEEAYDLMGIFARKTHPSAFKAGTVYKESFGLFGLLNRCQSTVGSKRLRVMMRQPSNDPEFLAYRYDHIEFFSLPHNNTISLQIRQNLKGFTSPINVLNRMKSSVCSKADWSSLYKTIKAASIITNICDQLMSGLTLCSNISECWHVKCSTYDDSLSKLWDTLELAIDVDQLDPLNQISNFFIRSNYSTNLDELKLNYSQLSQVTNRTAQEEIEDLPDCIPACDIIYLAQVGFLLRIPRSLENQKYLSQLEDFKLIFETVTEAHYKSPRTRTLDDVYGDIQFTICDDEYDILLNLQDQIFNNSHSLMRMTSLLAELDCILALADVSRENMYCRPIICDPTDSPRLVIRGGRHPLFDLTNFILNDTKIDRSINILSGVNGSGKTIYLKQIALIIYMASIGCFVPAEYMEFQPFDSIHVHMSSFQSNSEPYSQFMTSLNRLSRIINHCGRLSFVVIDEFGSETDYTSAVSLFVGAILYLASFSCPLLFMTCHHCRPLFLRFKDSSAVAFKQMSSLVKDGELVHLHQVIDGVCTDSRAFDVINLMNFPEDVIRRSEQIYRMIKENSLLLPSNESDTFDFDKSIYKAICDRFIQCDIDTCDLSQLFDEISSIAGFD